MAVYYVRGRHKNKYVTLNIEGIPPCLYCDQPVVAVSTSDPLICVNCALGRNADGSWWSAEDISKRHEHFDETINKLRRTSQEIYINQKIWPQRGTYGEISQLIPLAEMTRIELDKLFIELESRLIQLETNGKHDIEYRRWFAETWISLINEEIARRQNNAQ
jgi:hypothetical protein